jgi:P27 family predicted phage terminase small subunit
MTKPQPKPRPRRAVLDPPAHLSADAARLWRPVVTHLANNGQLLSIDVGVIESYCLAVIRQRQLTAALDKSGLIDKDGKPHPALRTIEATANTIRNLAHVLGLSPMSRRTLPSKPNTKTKGSGPWAGVLE